MLKTILITGSTDGIGLATAKKLLSMGHKVLIHGRSSAKLKTIESTLSRQAGSENIESYLADLSRLSEVEALAQVLTKRHSHIDVLINNAGIFQANDSVTADGLDIRFAVNTIAPYLLTQRLLPLLGTAGRVINLSSAAQSPVDLKVLIGQTRVSDDFSAYAQSKLALTTWSRNIALSLKDKGPTIIAVNPGSLLGSKMVRQGFGVTGNSLDIGVDILARAALSDEFASASGQYFDNDAGQFSAPHPDALDEQKSAQVEQAITQILARCKS